MLGFLVPEGAEPIGAALVIIAAFFTSALTAGFGLGGGVALVAIMSLLLPVAAVIPVHGAAQVGSNASRFYLLRASTMWPVVGWFSAGAALGAIIGARTVIALPEAALQALIGAFVLLFVWSPRPKRFHLQRAGFAAFGAVGTFLTMFIGATGPITAAMFSATRFNRMQIVSSHAACMVIQHLFKSLAFGAIGFAYGDWMFVIITIIAAGALGSIVGVRVLKQLPEDIFQSGFRIILTLIAVYLLVRAATT